MLSIFLCICGRHNPELLLLCPCRLLVWIFGLCDPQCLASLFPSSPMCSFIQVSLTSLICAARLFRASCVSLTVWALQMLDFRASKVACESKKNNSPHVSMFTVNCLATCLVAMSSA